MIELTRRHVAAASLLATPLLLLRGHQARAQADAPTPDVGNAHAMLRETAVEAYIYGYPLITMEMTRRVSTNVVKPEGTRAPMGQFANLGTYPTAAFRSVTAPNADTLYSIAWLDLADGPWVLHVPDAHGRYYLMPMLEGWTNVFADPGTRTTGTGALASSSRQPEPPLPGCRPRPASLPQHSVWHSRSACAALPPSRHVRPIGC